MDQGRNFESKIFRELLQLLGIKKMRTSALHSQSDGQMKCQHQTILNYLAFIDKNQKDWDRQIPMYLLTYRSSKHEAIGVTPAKYCILLKILGFMQIYSEETPPPTKYEGENSTNDYLSKTKKLEEVYD